MSVTVKKAKKWQISVTGAIVAASVTLFCSCQTPEANMIPENINPTIMKTPESIETEHHELHRQLELATKLPGETGVHAKKLAHLMHPHFKKEEDFALPPLTLLLPLAKGTVTEDMKKYIPLCDTLKKTWSTMLKEHGQIKQQLDLLKEAAEAENHPEVAEFAESLKLHAKTEEEILYPTAILVGEYLKLKLPG